MESQTIIVGTILIAFLFTVGAASSAITAPEPKAADPAGPQTPEMHKTTVEETATPEPDTTGTPSTREKPTLTMSHSYTDRIQLGENATIDIKVTDVDGSPVSGANVSVRSLGYGPGYFIEDTPVQTDSNGEARVTWHFTVPGLVNETKMRSFGNWPPAETVSFYAKTTVDGEKAEDLVTLKINPKCQNCHSKRRDPSGSQRFHETFP